MLYMVVYRTPNIREWRNYGVTNTKEAASQWCADLMRLDSNIEVRMLSAGDGEALQALFARQNSGGILGNLMEMPGFARETTQGKAPTSFMRWGQLPDATEDTRREQMEDGPGGDHDQPYHYQDLAEGVKAKLVRTLARVLRGEVGGIDDGYATLNVLKIVLEQEKQDEGGHRR